MINDCKEKNKSRTAELSEFLKVIAEENRLQIICFLKKNENNCVQDIWKHLNLPQNLVSHHLKTLKDFGLVRSSKQGIKVCYKLNRDELEKYQKMFENLFNNR